MMLNWFEYDGEDSRDYGLYILQKQPYNAPQRDISFISVAGRDGDLIIDNGRYKNVDISLKLRLFAKRLTSDENGDFLNAYKRVLDWLQPNTDYKVLADSYDLEYYRKAVIKSALTVNRLHADVADLSLSMSCKPYKYRFDGDKIITCSGGQTTIFYNDENAEALPLIRVYATDALPLTVYMNGRTYAFSSVDGYVDVDSETMNVFKGTTNKNSTFNATAFPKIIKGANSVSMSSNASKIEIKPRWRSL